MESNASIFEQRECNCVGLTTTPTHQQSVKEVVSIFDPPGNGLTSIKVFILWKPQVTLVFSFGLLPSGSCVFDGGREPREKELWSWINTTREI